jgi:hypothetical protein
MRGRASGYGELLSFPAGSTPAGNDPAGGPVVSAGFDETLPVGPSELDAIEAYLMPQILALLQEADKASTNPLQRTRKCRKALQT